MFLTKVIFARYCAPVAGFVFYKAGDLMRQPASLFRGEKRWFFLVFILLLPLSALPGCAAREGLRTEADNRDKYYIAGVPFFQLVRQENSCGPAALASILSFWDEQIGVEQIASRVCHPQLRGSHPLDMQRFLSEQGFLTVSTAGAIDDLKAQVRRNVPVISLLDLGFGPYRSPHYVTVIGFDDAEGAAIVHDGLTANKKIEYGTFLKAWDRAGNWMLVALPGTEQGRKKQ